MKKLLFTIITLLLSVNTYANGFYIKITSTQYNSFVKPRIDQIKTNYPNWFLTGKEVFKEYTYFILDESTGDKYYKIENIQYENVKINIINYINDNYPSLTQYNSEYVKQFLPEVSIWKNYY